MTGNCLTTHFLCFPIYFPLRTSYSHASITLRMTRVDDRGQNQASKYTRNPTPGGGWLLVARDGTPRGSRCVGAFLIGAFGAQLILRQVRLLLTCYLPRLYLSLRLTPYLISSPPSPGADALRR